MAELVSLPYIHRVTKFGPADRDQRGYYVGPEDIVSDLGPQEAAYLKALAVVAAEVGVSRLAIREPALTSAWGLASLAVDEEPDLARLFPEGLAGFYDGAEVDVATALELVRIMLREERGWCRLEAEGRFTVRLGWDQYMYLGTAVPCESAFTRVQDLGLFPERLPADPYEPQPEHEFQRPADEEFWQDLQQAVLDGHAGLLEEGLVSNQARWHVLTPENLQSLRARLAPRALLTVWLGLSGDVEDVIARAPEDGPAEYVWQEPSGSVRHVVVDEEEREDVVVLLRRATAATVLSVLVDERVALMTAVLPDEDGVVRARWQWDPTPADREWAADQAGPGRRRDSGAEA